MQTFYDDFKLSLLITLIFFKIFNFLLCFSIDIPLHKTIFSSINISIIMCQLLIVSHQNKVVNQIVFEIFILICKKSKLNECTVTFSDTSFVYGKLNIAS